jgi:hypothetical protein
MGTEEYFVALPLKTFNYLYSTTNLANVGLCVWHLTAKVVLPTIGSHMNYRFIHV